MRDTIPATGGEAAEDRGRYNGQLFWHRIHAGLEEEVVPGMTYPQDIRNCESCHDKTAAGGDSWYTKPSIAACGSCHSDLNFVDGREPRGRPGDRRHVRRLPQARRATSSGTPASRTPTSFRSTRPAQGLLGHDPLGFERGPRQEDHREVPAHRTATARSSTRISTRSPRTVRSASSSADRRPTTLNVGMLANGQPFSESPATATVPAVYDPATGTATYTFVNAIPAAAKGTYTVSIDTRRPVALNPAPREGPDVGQRGRPEPALLLRGHGDDGRSAPHVRPALEVQQLPPGPQGPLLARQPAHHDRALRHLPQPERHRPRPPCQARRIADPGESIEFARMIHRIHTGEELTQDFTIFGNSGVRGQLQRRSVPRRPPELPRLPRERGCGRASAPDHEPAGRHGSRLLLAARLGHGGLYGLP